MDNERKRHSMNIRIFLIISPGAPFCADRMSTV